MGWFKRSTENIKTSTKDKKETPEGLWYKCPTCKTVISTEDHKQNLWVCANCNHHEKLSADEYFSLIFDNQKCTEFSKGLVSADPLKFEDTKKYTDRVKATQAKTGLKDAIKTVHGKINGDKFVVAAMDFKFIGGSLGSVMGEKIVRAIDMAIKMECPFMIISKSGGARMMEASLSLMQMAKVSAKLTQLSDAKLPYISFLSDPTTGGVTASFAMLGDVNISEPNALIAFAGPRVVKETIGRDLPEGFQRSEFVLEHGFLDYIVERKNLKETLSKTIKLFAN